MSLAGHAAFLGAEAPRSPAAPASRSARAAAPPAGGPAARASVSPSSAVSSLSAFLTGAPSPLAAALEESRVESAADNREVEGVERALAAVSGAPSRGRGALTPPSKPRSPLRVKFDENQKKDAHAQSAKEDASEELRGDAEDLGDGEASPYQRRDGESYAAFAERLREREGAPLYLDNNSSTVVDPRVLEEMAPFFASLFGNPGSGHQRGEVNRAALQEARERVANSLAVPPSSIVFTSGATESLNWAIKCGAESQRRRGVGRHIVTTFVEHPAVLEICRFLQEEHGFGVSFCPVDRFGFLSLEVLPGLLSSETALVSIPHANAEIGVVQPIEKVAKIVRDRAPLALLHVDCSQALGKVPVNVPQLGADLVTIAGHKIYAPKGVGALYVGPRAHLQPLLHGGGQEGGLRGGTENVPYCVALGKACQLIAEGWDEPQLSSPPFSAAVAGCGGDAAEEVEGTRGRDGEREKDAAALRALDGSDGVQTPPLEERTTTPRGKKRRRLPSWLPSSLGAAFFASRDNDGRPPHRLAADGAVSRLQRVCSFIGFERLWPVLPFASSADARGRDNAHGRAWVRGQGGAASAHPAHMEKTLLKFFFHFFAEFAVLTQWTHDQIAEVVRVNGPLGRLRPGEASEENSPPKLTEAFRALPNTLSLSIRGADGKEIVRRLRNRLCISAGCTCHGSGKLTSATLQAIDLDREWALGTVRVSTGRFTSMADATVAGRLLARFLVAQNFVLRPPSPRSLAAADAAGRREAYAEKRKRED